MVRVAAMGETVNCPKGEGRKALRGHGGRCQNPAKKIEVQRGKDK
jgi:hypothetical protein